MYNSINSDLLRGNTDTIILKALANGDRYGYDICREIERLSLGQYQLKLPTLYSSLRRLEAQGFVSFYWGENTNGGRRKYFALTDQGKSLFLKNQTEWELSRTIIDRLISDKKFDLSALPPLDPSFVREDEDEPVADKATEKPIAENASEDNSEVGNASLQEADNSINSNAANALDVAQDVSDIPEQSQVHNSETSGNNSPSRFNFSSLISYAENAQQINPRNTSSDFAEMSRRFEEMSKQINQQSEQENKQSQLLSDLYVANLNDDSNQSAQNSDLREPSRPTKGNDRCFNPASNIDYKAILSRLFKESDAKTVRPDDASKEGNETQEKTEEPAKQEQAPITEDSPKKEESAFEQLELEREKQSTNTDFVILNEFNGNGYEQSGFFSNAGYANGFSSTEFGHGSATENKFESQFRAEFTDEEIKYREFGRRDEPFINVNPNDYTDQQAQQNKNGYVVKTHNKKQNKEFDTQYYIFGNKLRFHSSVIVAIIMALEISALMIYFSTKSMNNSSNNWIYFLAYLIPFFVLSINFVTYRINPDKKTRSTYNLFNNLLFYGIIFLMLSMLTVLVNILVNMTLYNYKDYLVTIIVPSVVASNYIVYAFVNYKLIKSHKYAV